MWFVEDVTGQRHPRAEASSTARTYRDTLLSLITPAGIQASSAELFGGAIFGRDSLIVGLDVVKSEPTLARTIIRSLIRLQGTRNDRQSEEEPGRIHHEHRALALAPNDRACEIFHMLRAAWGIGTDETLTYYGSVDATPQFIRLVDAYVRQHGSDLLKEEVDTQTGERVSIRDAVRRATTWLLKRLSASSLGLLEFQRANPRGIPFQVLRDGATSYLHPDGTLANTRAPIASIEVQGLVYDALVAAARLVASRNEALAWTSRATALARQCLALFWLPEAQRFAMAIDRDGAGQPRHVRTASSLPAELLDTDLLSSCSDAERTTFTASLVTDIFSPQLLTPVGVRMRSTEHLGLLDYADYQGSHTSWVVSTNTIARGLRRQGFTHLAQELETRLLRGIEALGCHEFFYVDDTGVVCAPDLSASGHPEIFGTNCPEHTQAWTASAALRASQEPKTTQLPTHFERHVLRRVHCPVILPRRPATINTTVGTEREHSFLIATAAVA